jgi:exonuclease SbcC
MQLNRLRLVNFRQHADTELAFGAGLTGIIGPNGAGKSTLLEAIGFALYGTTAARGTRDSIRRRGAPPRSTVRVELEFDLGPHHYRLNRGLNQAELYIDADPSPIANSLGAVTENVGRLLGMNRDEFFNTYFTSQKELAVMAMMTAPERAQFLSRVLGYERLRQAQAQLRGTRTALRARVETLQQSLIDEATLDTEQEAAEHRLALARESEAAIGRLVDDATAEVSRAEPVFAELHTVREQVLKLDGDLKVAEHRVEDTRTRFATLDRQLAEAVGAKDRLVALEEQLTPLPALQAERQILDHQAEQHAARNAYQEQATEIRERLSELNDRLARLPEDDSLEVAVRRSQEERDASKAASAAAEEQRTAHVRDKQDAQTKRATLVEQYRDLKAQRERVLAAGADGDCPTCGRPLGEDLDGVIELLDRQLQDVEFNGSFYKKRLEQLKSVPAEVTDAERTRLDRERAAREAEVEEQRLRDLVRQRPALVEDCRKAEARLAELTEHLAAAASAFDAARHTEVRRQIEALADVSLQAERERTLAGKAESLVVEAAAAEQALSELEADAHRLQASLAELGFTEEAFQAAQAQLADARSRLHEAEKGLIQARADISAASEAVATVTRRREERRTMLTALATAKRDLALRQELDRAFSDLRTDLNASLRPELSDLASVFVRELTNDRYSDLELDEDYLPTLMEDGQPKPVVSGGEEDVANLALRLAISQMIAERAGQPLSLLILDEIFGSLDDDRRASVVELLHSLRDKFPQVVLITHIESVREGFDRVVRVTVDQAAGVARVHEERLPEPEDAGAAA